MYLAVDAVVVCYQVLFQHLLEPSLGRGTGDVHGSRRGEISVSYTHLDVYKRQATYIPRNLWHIPSHGGHPDFPDTACPGIPV